MIIKYPTGLYKSVIPKEPSDSGNITFTISSSDPPRTNLVYPKISNGTALRRRTPVPINDLAARNAVGILAFSISEAGQSTTTSNKKQYEAGQVLEFGNIDTKVVELMPVAPLTEVQHDTNLFNYDDIGLTEDEQTSIINTSILAQNTLAQELNLLKEERANIDANLLENQRLINETSRTISALKALNSVTPTPDVELLITRLSGKLDEYYAIRNEYADDAATVAAAAEETAGKLRAISSIVR